MRRVFGALVVTMIVQLLGPASAYALWEYIEPWSGPGWWKGPQFDARVMCFVDRVSRQDRHEATRRTIDARQNAAPLRKMQFPSALPAVQATFQPGITKAVADWNASLNEWESVLNEWQRLAGRSGDKTAPIRQLALELRTRAEGSLRAVVEAASNVVQNADGAAPGASPERRAAFEAAVASYSAAAGQAVADAIAALDAYEHAAEAMAGIADMGVALPLPAPGYIFSACRLRENERRRAVIDIGMRFLWTEDDRYANGEQINFTTIEPAFSWSVFDDTRYDVVDYGIGAGFYWVSSKAFPALQGGFLEPIRLDFHLPTDAARKWRYLRALVFRIGVLTVPGGFDRGAFLPTNPADPRTNERIARDWFRSYGFYLDTEFFHKRRPPVEP